ncbi:cytochrome c oxidase subunit IVB [Oceanobacillus piezotolerans]|uniref:Cytochrome c oxidase subunit IVB n=1 Tax=Oceanobacillus piezotolerans TaxID=2448030 RepID=A0A498D9B1_9BACI|nr:cytochrome c oxidase subunit IVB [Oceanobacillus piezotolerans]RLL45211.1 cytochrome c oxidase subunit IVB [Oceanobacillus piezotolerans]
MTENTSMSKLNSYQNHKSKEEMKHQVITFALMIIFTLIAFYAVAVDMDKIFVIPLILILAIVQVGFQFYYFMHMKDKGHELVALLIFGGIWVAAVAILTFTTIIWW